MISVAEPTHIMTVAKGSGYMTRTIGEVIEHCKAQGNKYPDACLKCDYYKQRSGCVFYARPADWRTKGVIDEQSTTQKAKARSL